MANIGVILAHTVYTERCDVAANVDVTVNDGDIIV
jgi:hypothetical protein